LAPATIVGSAAFNFLFITAMCIPAVDEPKKIFDMGVFLTTSFFSVFAYLWLYYCISISSPGFVTRVEAWITIGFFVLLLILAFMADKYNQYKIKKAKSEDEKRDDDIRNQKSGLKTRLREIQKLYDELTVISIAHNTIGDKIEKSVITEVTELLKELFEVENTKELSAHEI
jgi:Ca2+/Na+ antiporter